MSRHRRPRFFRFYITCLSLAVMALAGTVGLLIVQLSMAMAKGNLLGLLGFGAAIFACFAAIFFLVWGMLVLSRKKIRRSGK